MRSEWLCWVIILGLVCVGMRVVFVFVVVGVDVVFEGVVFC